MRAVPRSKPAQWFLAFVGYILLIVAGSALIGGCAAGAVDLDGDGVISGEELALDFEDRYATFRSFVALGVALADPDDAERARINAIVSAADEEAGVYAQGLRDGVVPGSALSNRRLARSLLAGLTEYLESGQSAAEAPE